MASAKRDFDLPQAEPAPYEVPQPVNYVLKYQAAVEHIRKLEAELESLQKDAKLVSIAQPPGGQPMLALDSQGRLYERRPDPAPRGIMPAGMIWVRIPGPLAE